MTRTTGSRNIKNFNELNTIETTSSEDIKHMSDSNNITALEEFKRVLKHQNNYLKWIESRHKELNLLRAELNKKPPKSSTYRKYMWYAEQSALLEAINSFEVFYKHSTINLAKAIRNYIPAERLKGTVDAPGESDPVG